MLSSISCLLVTKLATFLICAPRTHAFTSCWTITIATASAASCPTRLSRPSASNVIFLSSGDVAPTSSGSSLENSTTASSAKKPVEVAPNSDIGNSTMKAKSAPDDTARRTDNATAFANDVAHVIKELRAGEDMTVPELFRGGTKLSMVYVWDSKKWDRHISRWRYVRYMISLYKSRILRRIFPQLSVTMLWSICVFKLTARAHPVVEKINVSLTSLSLVSTFIAALLALRSNQGLSRLGDARIAWGRTVTVCRDTAQLLASYVSPYDKELGLLSARHLAMFGWLLKCRLREEDDSDIVNAMLTNPTDAAYVLNHRKRPIALIHRIRQIVGYMAGRNRLPYPAHQAVENNLLELNRIFGKCERIKGSCIPPLYTAHVSRLLVFYLFFLPFALQSAGVEIVADILVTSAVGFSMLGLDEISHILEQPFRLMPMQEQSTNTMMDVADAFVCQPPALKDNDLLQGDEMGQKLDFQYPFKERKEPPYW